MPIDTRASVLFWTEDPRASNYIPPFDRPGVTLTVISGGVSDDYLQGSALISTKGSCVLQGRARLTQGQRVWLTYTKPYQGSNVPITREIPRVLWVLSFFADPVRGTISVELGCPFTYYRDFVQTVPLRSAATEEDIDGNPIEGKASIITSQIAFKEILNLAFGALGFVEGLGTLVFRGVGVPGGLSIEEFRFDAPYLSVANDILLSFSAYAYVTDEGSPTLDRDPIVVIESLETGPKAKQFGGGGQAVGAPILTANEIIDIGPLNYGSLPAQAVVVDFSHLKLKVPDDVEVVCDEDDDEDEDRERITGWSTDTANTTNRSTAVFSYQDSQGQTATQVFTTVESTYDETQYKLLLINGEDKGELVDADTAYTLTLAAQATIGPGLTDSEAEQVEFRNVITQRKTIESKGAVSIAGAWVTAALNVTGRFGNFNVSSETIERFVYDGRGNEVFRSLTRTGSQLYGLGMAGVPMEFDGQLITPPLGNMLLEDTTVSTYRSGNLVQTVTRRFGPWIASISGQQSVAEARDSFNSASDVQNYLNAVLNVSGGFLLDVTVSSERTGSRGEEVPSELAIALAELVDENSDPDNGFRAESSSESLYATGGDGGAKLVARYSMPYAPDDTFTAVPVPFSDPRRYCYRSSSGGADAVATKFGRTQNRIALGVRNGMGIQLAPESIPSIPFAATVVDLSAAQNPLSDPNRLVATYGVNGAAWTFDSQGMVASFDGIYWGINGR
jgi:hypothetical protein